MSERQLVIGLVMEAVTALVLITLGLIGFRRHVRRSRGTRTGWHPAWVLIAVLVCGGAVIAAFTWRALADPRVHSPR